ncbi:MAG: FAD-dependent oxidoreductase [Tardiphaga sp.]
MTAPRSIVIAGAGIGGLTAALALAARGFRVTVLEKADRLEEAGAGLQLSPNASRILIALGLQPHLLHHVTCPDAVSIMTARSGGAVIRLPLTARDNAPYWALRRADLQSALLAAVRDNPAIAIRLGVAVTGFAVTPGGVTVNDEDAWALIGADGVWSAVRGRLYPDVRPQFSGLVAWRGTREATQPAQDMPPRQVQLWMGPRAHLVAYPMASGRRINMVAIVPGMEAGGSGDDIRGAFASSGWPAPARGMVDAVTDWRRWPLYTLPDGGVWHDGPVALLGDAAHAMLPFAAQGAGMAIEDAAVLARCLGEASNHGDVAAALARYADLRRPRVMRVQRTARQSGKIYHLRGPMALARDLVMQMLGAARLQARQNWIYDWRDAGL